MVKHATVTMVILLLQVWLADLAHSQLLRDLAYDFVQIDFPNAAATVVYGSNDRGDIVGEYGDIDFSSPVQAPNRGFWYDGTSYRTIHFPNSYATAAFDINNHGEIVGDFMDNLGLIHAFRYSTKTDTYSEILTTLGLFGRSAQGINDNGVVVGTYLEPGALFGLSVEFHGFIASSQGATTTIDYDPGTRPYPSIVTGVNTSDYVVGNVVVAEPTQAVRGGFTYSPYRRIDLIDKPTTQFAFGVNDQGTVVGTVGERRSKTTGHFYGYLFDAPSNKAIGLINLPGGDCDFVFDPDDASSPPVICVRSARRVDESNRIVGYFDNNDADFHGFVGRPKVPADFNWDQAVDAADAGTMFSNWGGFGLGDLSEDDIVDAADAGHLFAAWTGDSIEDIQSVPEPAGVVAVLGVLFAGSIARFARAAGGSQGNRRDP